MRDILFQLVSAAVGTFGFALCTHVSKKHLATATLGGLLSWAVYLIVNIFVESLFWGCLISAIVVYIWSEVMARVMKAPVTIFLLLGIIPLLPGSFLYYTVLALLDHQNDLFQFYGTETIMDTMGIACGVVIASVVSSYIIKSIERSKEKRC